MKLKTKGIIRTKRRKQVN